MTDVSQAPENNGATSADAVERVVPVLRQAIDELELRQQELRGELAQVDRRRKDLDRALRALTGEAAKFGPKPPGTKPKRAIPAKVGPQRLARIEAAVRAYAADHEEFRQVDIRQTLGGFNSSTAALAFEQLRQANVIRVARQDGNSKIYRLTREALRAER